MVPDLPNLSREEEQNLSLTQNVALEKFVRERRGATQKVAYFVLLCFPTDEGVPRQGLLYPISLLFSYFCLTRCF